MRQIKFRAWNKKSQQMRYDAQNDVVDISEKRELVGITGGFLNTTFFAIAPHDDNMSLMQFTGTCDRHGKEIYEGDIVRQNNQNEFGSFMECVGQISWCSAHVGFEVRGKNYSPETGAHTVGANCEVIGNIYENPELLK